uniref:TACO1/YebC-like N-terminal domain-containing protein n=1 Tax=Timema genevievae TaxID=629358 RepID=A0A7R9K016_TIMGE|nr:unnamed protein product [Timema genevievae]
MWAWKLRFLSYVTPKYLVVWLHLIAWRSIFSEGFLRSVPLNNISSTKATNPTIPGSASISSNTSSRSTSPNTGPLTVPWGQPLICFLQGNGTNPDFNVQLSQAIEQAKKNSMPRATVENAINQAKRPCKQAPAHSLGTTGTLSYYLLRAMCLSAKTKRSMLVLGMYKVALKLVSRNPGVPREGVRGSVRLLCVMTEVDEKKLTKMEITRWHGIPKSTLFTILKMREKIVNVVQKEGHNVKAKNLNGAMHANLEQAMLEWFSQH